MQRARRVVFLLAGLALLLALVRALLRRLCSRPARPAAALADPDSRFVDVDGVQVHYKQAGTGQPVLLLLHGSFLSLHSWREVLAPLAEHATVIACDRPAFGLTSRPMPTSGSNPYSPEAQADLAIALLERLGIERAVLVGNSTGGTIALLAALRHPQRVQALVLADAMVYSGYAVSEFPAWLRPLLRALGGVNRLLVRCMVSRLQDTLIRSFWHDKTQVTAEVLQHYRRAQQMQHWDRALWELIQASHALGLDARLSRLQCPVLVITGEHDRTVPTAESIRLAEALPAARLEVLPACAHLPQEERPQAFTEALLGFLPQAAAAAPPTDAHQPE